MVCVRRVERFWRVGSGKCNDGLVALSDVRQWGESHSIPAISTDGIRSLSHGVVKSKLFLCVSGVGQQRPRIWKNVGCNW